MRLLLLPFHPSFDGILMSAIAPVVGKTLMCGTTRRAVLDGADKVPPAKTIQRG
jgi:hypothetical protein